MEESVIRLQNYHGVMPYMELLTLKVTAEHLDHGITIEISKLAPFSV